MELMRVPDKVKVSWIWSLSMFHFDSYCCTFLNICISIVPSHHPIHWDSHVNLPRVGLPPRFSGSIPGDISGCDDDEDRDHNKNYSGYKFDTRVEWLGHAFDPRRSLERMGWGIFRRGGEDSGTRITSTCFFFFCKFIFSCIWIYIYKSLNGLFV